MVFKVHGPSQAGEAIGASASVCVWMGRGECNVDVCRVEGI